MIKTLILINQRFTKNGKNLLFNVLIFIIYIFTLGSCKKDNSDTVNSKYTVYTAGFIWNNGNFPCYWKGNSRTDLPGGTGAFTTSIFVSGGIVYTAGYYYNSKGLQAPCYWNGTTKIDLPYDITHDAYTTSIFVSNGNVYTSGHCSTGACYWVNSVRKEMVGHVDGDFYSSIYVLDTLVYLAGSYQLNKFDFKIDPCYWVGNKRTDLSVNSSNYGQANSIYISNGTVYTCGYCGDYPRIPCYWTESIKTDLETNINGYANSICVEGGSVYTAGYLTTEGFGACFWNGTSRTDLKGYSHYGTDAVSICAKGGAVFTAGRYYKPDPNNLTTGFHFPCYWIGNNRVDLQVAVDHDHNSTTSIFVE